jgi:hypothetical protein
MPKKIDCRFCGKTFLSRRGRLSCDKPKCVESKEELFRQRRIASALQHNANDPVKHAENWKRYYQKNRGKILEKRREWRLNAPPIDRAIKREYEAAYREKNREKIKAREKAKWEKIKEEHTLWLASQPED